MSQGAPAWQAAFDELVAFATGGPRRDALLESRAEFFERTGEIFEDDKQFEARMASMLEFHVFDRPSRSSGLTPAREYYLEVVTQGPPERAAGFRKLTETLHSLFLVRRLKEGSVTLEDLHDGATVEVAERRALAGLGKGDVLEARLISWDSQPSFAPAFCFHPRQVAELIGREARRRRKASPEIPRETLIWDCARRSLKADRYRNVALEKIYDFSAAG